MPSSWEGPYHGQRTLTVIYGIILNAPSSSPLDTVNAIRKGNDVMGFYTAQLSTVYWIRPCGDSWCWKCPTERKKVWGVNIHQVVDWLSKGTEELPQQWWCLRQARWHLLSSVGVCFCLIPCMQLTAPQICRHCGPCIHFTTSPTSISTCSGCTNS